MQTIKNYKLSILSILLLLMIVPLTACAADKSPGQHNPVKGASLTISFSPEAGFTVIDKNGEPLSACAPPCSDGGKYGKRCPEVKLPICEGLKDASVTDITTLTIIESAKNPYCYTSCYGGNCVERCY